MCTLTIVPTAKGLAITMNRDEQRTRAEVGTLLSGWSEAHQVSYAYPLDGLHGGTWMGANSHGVVLALLNRYQDPGRPDAESRGLIISELIRLPDIDAMLDALREGLGQRCNPFELILIGSGRVVACHWNGTACSFQEHDQNRPNMFTSSSVNAESTVALRSDLFQTWLAGKRGEAVTAEMILEELHLRQERDDPSSSILMSRELSHTKSISQVLVQPGLLEFLYLTEALLPGVAAARSIADQPRHRINIA